MTLAGSFGVRHLPAGTRRVAESPLALAGLPIVETDGIFCALDSEDARVAVPLARAFRESGATAFATLRDDFVAVVWDSERRRGALARGRAGGRPLHVVQAGGGLLFASELRDLLRLLPATPPPDEAWLAHWLGRQVAPPALTPYAGISRVPAGHFVWLEGERWRAAPWWRPRPERTLDLDASAAAVALREEMGLAVERTTASAASPGVLLSGGFDSACVAALARRGGAIHAYSGVFPAHPAADESERIAILRDELEVTGPVQSFEGGGALRATLGFIEAWKVPPASPNVFLWHELLAQAARDGRDVVLDGEGGDELFGCSPPLLADMLLRGRLPALIALARRIPGMGDAPRPRWIARALRKYGVGAALPAGLHRRIRRRRAAGPPGPEWLAPSLRDVVTDSHRDAWKELRGPRWWAALVDATGRGVDAMGAHDQFRREAIDAGLRLAHPWRDPELIDFVLRLPPELAFDSHMDRPLARAAMDGLVPDAVLQSDAKPYFNDPLSDALTGPDREILFELATAPQLQPYVEADAVARLLEPTARPAWALDVWRVASAGAWLRSLDEPLDGLLERAQPVAVTISAGAPVQSRALNRR